MSSKRGAVCIGPGKFSLCWAGLGNAHPSAANAKVISLENAAMARLTPDAP